MSETETAKAAPILVAICKEGKSLTLRKAALNALRHYPDPAIGAQLIALYSKEPAELRSPVLDILSSRRAWAQLLVSAVEEGKIARDDISRDVAGKMASLKDTALTGKVQRIWGRMGEETAAEKQSFISRAKLILNPSGVVGRVPTPDLDSGRKLFQENCGICHKLYGEGNNIGPDLSGVDRKSTDFLLRNIVDPSAYIRPEYVAYDLESTDDESLTGLMAESTPSAVTLVDRTNQKHTIPRARIRILKESAKSLMPEGLLENLKPQQIIDLVGYLQAH